MSSGYILPVDPSVIAGRFSHDLVDLEEAANITDEDVADLVANDYECKIAPLLDRIPAKEADFIELSYIHGKSQRDIATIFGVTQAGVSYRILRGIHRLKFLLSIPHVTEDELRADLPELFPLELPCPLCCCLSGPTKSKAPPALPAPGEVCRVCHDRRVLLIDVAILVGMWRTTCQLAVAEDLNITQDRARHRFLKAVEVLEQAAERDPRFRPYAQLFAAIRGNLQILHEVYLPQFADRGGDECF